MGPHVIANLDLNAFNPNCPYIDADRCQVTQPIYVPFTPAYKCVYQILSKKSIFFDEKEKKVSSGLGILGTHYQAREKGGRQKIH